MNKNNLKEIYKAIALTFFVFLIVLGGVFVSLSILKDEAIDTNLKIAEFHSNSLTEQITQTFVGLYLIIKDLDNSIVLEDKISILEVKFANIVLSNPYIRSISLLNTDKTIVYSSNKKNIGVKLLDANFYPKPMFDQKILRIGNPWIGRDFDDSMDVAHLSYVDKMSSSFLPVIKKITIDKKDFYIAININSDYFINKYATNLAASFATLELIRIDGMLLFSSDKNRQVGIQAEKTVILEEAIKKSKALGIETIEGRKYLTSYRLTDVFPLNVAVGLDFEKTMKKWEEKRALTIYIIALLVLFCIALVFTLIRRYAKEKQHELEFQKTTQKILENAKELAEKSNRAKSDFLANMSHEIRTPLNGIIGLTDLVLKTPLDEKQKDYLQKAQQSSSTLLYLINDILDYSKIEAGKLSLENSGFELTSVINDIKALFEYQASNRGISLEIDTPLNLDLVGDPQRLRQILTNIVGNAIKFTKKGVIKLTISIQDEDEKQLSLRFSVKDTGIGMSKEVQDSLFMKFTQGDSSITREYGGTGLGLSISKQLVELMGGKIWLESTPSVGSEFIFEIKFLKTDFLDKKESIKPLDNIKKFNSSRILLVEDNAINQLVAVGLLEGLGLSVDVANNGEEAVDKAKAKIYDLILMDIQMPIMDGFEATQKIREFDKEVPIVALSAAVMFEDKEKTKQAGMNAHLEKPIDQQKLSETILQFIKQNHDLAKFSIEYNSEKNSKYDFYGVDLDELKSRVGDNLDFVKQLLHGFCRDYACPEDKFDINNIQTDNFAKAIHALKGVSGNVSLKRIFELATIIDQSEFSTKKIELTLELIALLRETTKQLAVELEQVSPDNELALDYSENEIELFLKELLTDLEQFIAITPERTSILIKILEKTAKRDEVTSIKDDLNNYRYEEAKNKIQTLSLSLISTK